MYYLPYLGYQNSTTYFPRVNFHKKGNKKSVIFFLSFFILFYLVKKEPNRKNVLLEFSIKEHQTNLLPLFSLQSSPYDTYHATLRQKIIKIFNRFLFICSENNIHNGSISDEEIFLTYGDDCNSIGLYIGLTEQNVTN